MATVGGGEGIRLWGCVEGWRQGSPQSRLSSDPEALGFPFSTHIYTIFSLSFTKVEIA
jgi:hypothetical protein